MEMKNHFCINFLSFKLGGNRSEKVEVSKSLFENTWIRVKNMTFKFRKSTKGGKRLLVSIENLKMRLDIKYAKFDVIMNNVLGRDRESLPASMAINVS